MDPLVMRWITAVVVVVPIVVFVYLLAKYVNRGG